MKNAPTGSRRERRAFTLIELLTVIAIIGILASILIPTLGKVRENAFRSQCASNIRQIGLAILAYEAENGILPGPTHRMIYSPLNPARPRGNPANPSAQNRCMSVILEGYLGVYHEGDAGPFHCETSHDGRNVDPRKPAYLLMRNIRTNPPSFFGDTDFSDDRRVPKSLGQIISAGGGSQRSRAATELSQIWMISDIDAGNWRNTGSSAGMPASLNSPAHDGGRNYMFFDGHMEFVRPGAFGWTYPANTGDPGNDS